MRSKISAAVLALVLGLAATAPLRAQEEHARYDFPVVVDGQEQVLTYEGTHDITRGDPNVKLVVFVHHGASENPVTYFNSMKAALEVVSGEKPDLARTTMIIAPAMISEAHVMDRPERYAQHHYPYWEAWREGGASENSPKVSNFDLLDGMVLQIVDRFPNVKAIVYVGHSAGAQLLSRYSLGTPTYDVLRQKGIYVRYIVSNPSSLLYFDRQRPDLISGTGFIDYSMRTPVLADGDCVGFNRYKYGLDGMVPYMTRRPVSALLAEYRQRDVILLQGLADTDPNDDSLDKDCPAMLMGRFRLERGQRYYEYLGRYFGNEIYQTKRLVLVDGLGHDSRSIFKSDEGRPLIFIDADSAAAAMPRPTSTATQPPRHFTLVIHGGSGVREPAEFAAHPGLEQAYRDTLAVALRAGYQVLSAGGSAVEAVEAAIRVMEDSPIFNAGKGASLTSDGTVELDASIMDGRTMRAGGIAAARHIRNPISMSRLVMERTPHVLVAGEGVMALAKELGVPLEPESYFRTEEKWQELQDRLRLEVPFGGDLPPVGLGPTEDDPHDTKLYGTVGAVALDVNGNLAAGTSTGGRILKRPGRVGDSPIIGASTYANNAVVAVSTTGLGEKHMVLLTGKEIAALMQYGGLNVQQAADRAVRQELVELGGGGGAIAVDRHGNFATPFTESGMYRGWVREDGVVEVRVYDR